MGALIEVSNGCYSALLIHSLSESKDEEIFKTFPWDKIAGIPNFPLIKGILMRGHLNKTPQPSAGHPREFGLDHLRGGMLGPPKGFFAPLHLQAKIFNIFGVLARKIAQHSQLILDLPQYLLQGD